LHLSFAPRFEEADVDYRRHVASSWELLAWPDLAERVSAAAVVLVPVGATEQHGPHLPLTTDTLIAERLCRAAADRTGALVAPAIPVGCSYGHGTRIPGTISLTPEQLIAIARQYVDWIARSGFRRILFVNAHAGNSAALSVATDYLRLERADLQVGAIDWWDLDPELRAAMLTDGQDVHANRAETSMMLALAPELVHLDRMSTADDPDRTTDLVFRYTADVLSTNGVTGRPSEATRELGSALLALASEALVRTVTRAEKETPPWPPAAAP
jgi:creatinine amidohydrolase